MANASNVFPIQIPPGMFRNGTDLEGAGRWRSGNLVRWLESKLQPIGGWASRSSSKVSNPVRGMVAFRSNSGSRYVGLGSSDKLHVMTAAGVLHDITPAGFTTGTVDAELNTGYGGGFFGTDNFGSPRPDTGAYAEANTWRLDTWGEYLVACAYSDGKLYEWQLNTAVAAAQISGSPTSCLGLVVTPERFIMALGAGGNPRKVQWCDREDNTTWTPLATNEAGDQELQTPGQIMRGIRTRGETLIITDRDAWVANYVGPPFVYGFSQVGDACGLSARGSAIGTKGGVFWMGQRGFFRYNGGEVESIPCDVLDYVFTDLNQPQRSKVWAFANEQFNEVWWVYPSSTECDKYVYFNYLTNHWSYGEIDRTCGVDRSVFKNPILVSSGGELFDHETGFNHHGQMPFVESGPLLVGAGGQVASFTELIPDEGTQGEVTMTFKTRFNPNDTEYSHGPYTMGNPTGVRFTGRQFRARVDAVGSTNWRFGVPRLRHAIGGRR